VRQEALYALLDTLDIGFIRVEHPAFSSIEDYHKAGIGFPGQCVKNLLLKNRKGSQYYLLILDELKTADLAALAEQIGEKRLSFASEGKLMELMGVTPGSVTPFALADDRERQITVLLDDTLAQNDRVGFHPLDNRSTLCIHYTDLQKFLAHTGHTPVPVRI